MTARFEGKTLVRLVVVIAVTCVLATVLAGPRAQATDGYGVSTTDLASLEAPVVEGRSVSTSFTLPSLR